MELGAPKPRLSQLLENEILSRVERMRLNPRRRFTNRAHGEHLSGKGGSSTEFADYRDYAEGDDIRFVDWNIFSRLHRPYLKLFHHEEEMHVVLVIDASQSMSFENKLDQAKRLAMALGVMGLFAIEKVSVYASGQDGLSLPRLSPCSGRGSLRKFLHFIEGIECGGEQTFDQGIQTMLRHHRGRGMVVLLSDFLSSNDFSRAFNRLFSAGLEIFAIQILAPAEIEPQITGDSRLVDSESLAMLDITAGGNLLSIYQEYREALEKHLESLCQARMGRFLSISSQEPIRRVLFDLLQRRGWVR